MIMSSSRHIVLISLLFVIVLCTVCQAGFSYKKRSDDVILQKIYKDLQKLKKLVRVLIKRKLHRNSTESRNEHVRHTTTEAAVHLRNKSRNSSLALSQDKSAYKFSNCKMAIVGPDKLEAIWRFFNESQAVMEKMRTWWVNNRYIDTDPSVMCSNARRKHSDPTYTTRCAAIVYRNKKLCVQFEKCTRRLHRLCDSK